MIVNRRYSQLTRISFSLDRHDLAELLRKDPNLPNGFSLKESSLDGDWPLIVTFERDVESPETQPDQP